MSGFGVIAVLLSIRSLTSFTLPCKADSTSTAFAPGQIVVSFRNKTVPALSIGADRVQCIYPAVDCVLAAHHLTRIQPINPKNRVKNLYVLMFPDTTNVEVVASELRGLGELDRVETRGSGRLCREPNDTYWNSDYFGDGTFDQWTLRKMQLDRAWDITTGSSEVVVAVVDDGVDWYHPDLSGRLWFNALEDANGNGVYDPFRVTDGGDIDFLDSGDPGDTPDDVLGADFAWDYGWSQECKSSEPIGPVYLPCWDEYAHGTYVASNMTAQSNNSFGIAGPSWNARIMIVRAFPLYGAPTSVAIANGIDYAVEMGADIINMSFADPEDETEIRDAIERAHAAGVILVASAGDDDSDSSGYPSQRYYPGSYPEVIRVAAVDYRKYKTRPTMGGEGNGASNYGFDVDICAPIPRPCIDGICHPEETVFACAFWMGSPPQEPHYPDDAPPHRFGPDDMYTSGAAAEVSGVLALIKSMYPDSSREFIEGELFRGTEALGTEALPDPLWNPDISLSKLGHGMVNAYRSLTHWGTISENTTWSNVVYVSGDVTIAPGSTLTIDPGTTIFLARDDNEHTGADPELIEFNVEGYLDVNGTPASPVVFRSWMEEGVTRWCGFYFDSQSDGGSFEHCTIKNAGYGIESWVQSPDFVAISHCMIDSCGSGVVVCDGFVSIANSNISNYDLAGVFLAGGYGTPVATMINCTVRDGIYGACVADDAFFSATGSSFLYNSRGLWINENASPVVVEANCEFKHNNIGIHVYNSVPTINHSVVDSNSTDGIYCQHYGGATIHDNDIRYNCKGIYCYDHVEPVADWNEIAHNVSGVEAATYSEPDLGYGSASQGHNVFQYNSAGHVANLTQGLTVMAELNYWGNSVEPCFPKANKIVGLVDYDPALCGLDLVSGGPGNELTEERQETVPSQFALGPAVPNPFNPSTTIHYDVPRPGTVVSLRIFNVSGQLVRVLVNEFKEPGYHRAVWDGVDSGGSPVASSVYFLRMNAGSYVETEKIILLK